LRFDMYRSLCAFPDILVFNGLKMWGRVIIINLRPSPSRYTKGRVRMNDVIGIAWFEDELAYCGALGIFADPENMPATFADWRALVGRECELIKDGGNIALRVDIDPETFPDWCALHGFKADAQGRIAFVNHVELEYRKTGKGTVIG
jgi:hypothetical protein